MRQQTEYLTAASYRATISATLLAGHTITDSQGCTFTIGGAAPTLPHTLALGEVLDVIHTAGAGVLSNLRMLAPDSGAGGAANSGSVARLSSTQVARPSARALGASQSRGVTNLVMTFTLSGQMSAEGVTFSAPELALSGPGSVFTIYLEDANGTALAYDLGTQSLAAGGGTLNITFAQVANLPPGDYTLRIRFAPNTNLTLGSNPQLFNGMNSAVFDNTPGLFLANFAFVAGPGNVLGRLSAGAMRVVAAPTLDPDWYDGCFEVVAAPTATPYLRARHEGVSYRVALVPE